MTRQTTTPFAGCCGTARFRIGQVSDAGMDGGIGGPNCCAGCTWSKSCLPSLRWEASATGGDSRPGVRATGAGRDGAVAGGAGAGSGAGSTRAAGAVVGV